MSRVLTELDEGPENWLADLPEPSYQLDLLIAISLGTLFYVLLAVAVLYFVRLFQGR